MVSMRSLRRAIFFSIRLAVGGLRLTCAKPGERGRRCCQLSRSPAGPSHDFP
jgi:hypothetical protein